MASSIVKSGRKGQRGNPSGATVSIPLADLLYDAEAGLLGLSVQVGLRVLEELMDQEVTEVAGPKGRHNPQRTTVRPGVEDGYVFLGDRRVPVTHPRVRTTTGQDVPLTTSQTFQDAGVATQAIMQRMFFGLASRQQGQANPALSAEVGTHGLSKSAVSRRFIRATQQALDTFLHRSLDDRTWGVLMVDGIRVGGHLVVVALGIDAQGHKRILGLAEGRGHRKQHHRQEFVDGPRGSGIRHSGEPRPLGRHGWRQSLGQGPARRVRRPRADPAMPGP